MTHAVKMTAFDIVVRINRKMLLEMAKKKVIQGIIILTKLNTIQRKPLSSFLMIFSFHSFIGHIFFFFC